MLGITFIGSGSKGNSALLELNHSYYLLDAGISCKKICDFLALRGLSLTDLKGIFVTHEHDDHIKGLKVLLKKAPHLKIYCTRGTASEMLNRGISLCDFQEMHYDNSLLIENCKCTAFAVPHDAVQPMGLHIENKSYIMAMATDLGCVTTDVIKYTQNADLLCIESNYDMDLLKSSSYPEWLKQRIKSRTGHLPNEGVRGILSRMKKVPKGLILMHLSQESNTEEKAREALDSFFEFGGAKFKSMEIEVACQDCPSRRLSLGSDTLPSKIKEKLLVNSDSSLELENFSKLC